MILWLVIGLMTAGALAALVIPLIVRPRAAPPRADYDLAIYRDQLKELESDLSRGLISENQAVAARTEIERRMLNAARGLEATGAAQAAPARPRLRWLGIGLLGTIVPAAAIGLYVTLGQPGLPSRPFAGVPAAPAQTMAGRGVEEATQNLLRRLAENPEDIRGWVLLGRSYVALERYDDAVEALRRALALSQGDLNILAFYAEALVLAADGMVTEDARRAFNTVRDARPDDIAARYYLARAELQAERVDKALEMWLSLAADTPREVPWRDALERDIRRAASVLGADLDEIPAAPSAEPTPRGPSEEDIAAAGQMSPQERLEMIRDMVDGLAARLEEDPSDIAGWRQLARSYEVLGESEKAAEARRRIAALEADADPAGRERPTAGPTTEDMAAAAEMAPAERAEMIRGMVDGLAARLRENPNDLAGWRMLARSYRVLGEEEKAADAERRAAELEAASRGAEPSAGPSAADMEAAATLAPEERAEMIRDMVDGLAERLSREPDDLAGWLQLGRSYGVLGEHGKALEAFQRAADLAPNSVTVLRDYARAITAATPDPQGLPAHATTVYERILTLDANHPEALWFVGFARLRQGDTEGARTLWTQLLSQIPPGTPDHRAVQEAINAL